MDSVKAAFDEAWNVDAYKYIQAAGKEFESLFRTNHFRNMY